MLESINIEKITDRILAWVEANILTIDAAIQASLIITALLAGFLLRRFIQPKIMPYIDNISVHVRMKMIFRNLTKLILPLGAMLVLVAAVPIGRALEYDMGVADGVMALLAAWVVIRLVVQFIENAAVRNLFAVTIWAIAALSIFGVLDETSQTLDSIGMDIGEFRLSALSVIKSLIGVFVLVYGALFLSGFLERKIQTVPGLTISSRVLISKVVRVTLIVIALLIAITSAGIDLSLFAVFSGAVGLGIGFGLQKGISNLFSGMMLLMDKSIKPGDIIELPSLGNGDSTFGWVQHMGARYTEIVTRDNKSYLIPNEDFITQQVTNWSHGDTMIRLEVKFGVHYDSDPHKVQEVAIEAAKTPERVVAEPQPVCWLYEFGDSSLNFKLRFWIKDAEKGVTNVRGQVMMALWDSFKENNIKIPYPHREVFVHDAPQSPKPTKKKTAAKKKAA